MNIVYPNLQSPASAWISGISPSINPKASLVYVPSSLPDGRLKVTNVGNVDYAGGLVARKIPPPQISGVSLTYAMLSTSILVPSSALYNLARLETDFLVILTPAPDPKTPIPNKFNGSTQLNFSTGNFMIDASSGAAAWSDIGAGPGKDIAPDVPHLLELRYQYDFAGKHISTLSITWDGTLYPVPAKLQNVGCQPSNWNAVMAIQKQTEMFTPGSVEVVYDRTTLTLSDQPL